MAAQLRIVSLSLVVSAGALGCGGIVDLPEADAALPEPTEAYRRQRSEIVGGTVDNGSPAVVALTVLYRSSYVPFCSGTLIGGRTILTAAHCVYSYGQNAQYYAAFGTYVGAPTFTVRIVQQVRHPGYNAQSLGSDIAVLRLETPVTQVAPVAINTTPLNSSFLGWPIRHSGFGVTSSSSNTMGTKRHVTYNIRQLSQTEIESGTTGKQTCSGDSGGPGFIILPNTDQEVVAGVVSYGDENCNQFGVDTNVAGYAAWVQTTMAQWEAPTCAEDGKCAANCAQPDIDCVCVADGVCSADCPDFSRDPDCPANCGADGVCSEAACPRWDEDCVVEGQACTFETECRSRICLGDPQHTFYYCSTTCTHSSQCPAGMECFSSMCRYEQKPSAHLGQPCSAQTFCLQGAVCMGTSASDTRCALPCSDEGTCPGVNQVCRLGFNGQPFCEDPAAAQPQRQGGTGFLANARVEGREAQGCSAAGGGPSWLLALGLLPLALVRRRGRAVAGAAAALLALSGCGAGTGGALTEDPALDAVRSEIVGGTVSYNDPEVFMLRMIYENHSAGSCTATLIGEQTLLTAAHCVDIDAGQSVSPLVFATNKVFANNATQQDWIRVTEIRVHPNWNSQTLSNDIALAFLQKPPGVEPKQWNVQPLAGLGGQPVRSVGYGVTSRQKGDSGTRREVTTAMGGISSSHFYVGDNAGKGICSGDSGGPTFHTFGDGRERVVGVHSFDANGVCTFGGVVRVDAHQAFIATWMQEKESPTCATDGKCLSGCTPVDLDCYCKQDGVCDARCPDLMKDSDCPVDCAKNGVCSLQECPVPDADCVADGLLCQSPMVCTGRMCTNDPQHKSSYCTRACADDVECDPGMACYDGACRFLQLPSAKEGEGCRIGATFCLGNTSCTGRLEDGPTTCQQTCGANADCAGRATCEYGQGYVRICQEPWQPPVEVKVLRPEYDVAPASQSCAAAPGGGFGLPGAFGLLGLALLVRPRRRR